MPSMWAKESTVIDYKRFQPTRGIPLILPSYDARVIAI